MAVKDLTIVSVTRTFRLVVDSIFIQKEILVAFMEFKEKTYF